MVQLAMFDNQKICRSYFLPQGTFTKMVNFGGETNGSSPTSPASAGFLASPSPTFAMFNPHTIWL